MPNLTTRLPVRHPGLICWQAGENGPVLVRDRQSGESFELGEEEHFLLEQIDGQHSAEEISRAFGERFGEPLSGQDLEEFIALATQHGLLQPQIPSPLVGQRQGGADCGMPTPSPQPSPIEGIEGVGVQCRRGSERKRSLWKRTTSRVLKLVSAVLKWPARMLGAAAARLDTLRLRRLDFVPRPDDVFIVTYPRSGTTWMQMILYQLTTGGTMHFPHIAEYCPWFEKSSRSRQAFETRPPPRLFKSHLPYRKIPKGPCKYIYVARDGKDVAVSYYHLDTMYNAYEGTFEEFFGRFLKGKTSFGSWFKHVRDWWAHRDDANVLFLTYEELSRNLEGIIRRIAGFIGRDVPPERLPEIVERCSFAFMKEHEPKFDPALESLWEQGIQLKSFLRNGRVGDGVVCLTEEQKAHFDAAFNKRLGNLKVPLS